MSKALARARAAAGASSLSALRHDAQGDPVLGPVVVAPSETAGAESYFPDERPAASPDATRHQLNPLTAWTGVARSETPELVGDPSSFRTGRPPEVVPSEAEARALLATYLKTNLNSRRGSMTAAARLFAHSDKCSPELREAILREIGPARSSKHQLPVTVKRAMQASQALVTHTRNPRDADVLFGHSRGVLRRHWSEQRRLLAGERMSFDDGSINFVVVVPWPWGGDKCSDRFGVRVGRFQFLPANDDASDFIPGFTFAVRPTGAYRAEDVCAAMGRLWRDTVKPSQVVLERGTWESQRVTALVQAAGVGIGRSYAPRQKLIEGVFNRLWTALSVMPGQVGRYRGEMERENKLLTAAQAGSLDPREHFVDLTVAMAALERAVQYHNHTPLESKYYGKWTPEQRWREDLAAHPRGSLDAALSYLWAPEIRTWTVRRACVGGMVEQPLGVTLPAHWWAPALLDCEGRRVTAHFDPWEANSPATLTLAEDWPQRGWKAGRVLAVGVPCLEDLPTIARDASDALAVQMGEDGTAGANERAKQMRATLRSIVLREYRVLAADGTRARRESEVRAPSVATDNPRQPDRANQPAAVVNRAQAELNQDEEAAELARIEQAERRHQPMDAPIF